MNDLGLAETPVLLGGAALTRNYVEVDLREVYEGRLFYGKDAFEGLHTMDTLMTAKKTGTHRPRPRPRAGRPQAAAAQVAAGRSSRSTCRRAPTSPTTSPIFTPPFLGARVAKGISLDEIAGFINETALFRNQWQFRPEGGESDDEFKARIRPDAARRARRREVRGLARARGRVGLLPGQRRRRRPRRLDRRRPDHRAVPVPLPAPAEGAVPLHRRLLPQRRLRRRRLRGLPRGDRRLRGDGEASASCSRRTSTRTTCCATASRSR